MSYAAKHALTSVSARLFDLCRQFEELSDKDLETFSREAVEYLEPGEPVTNELWKGISAAAAKQLERRRARRSLKGKWFASIEKLTREPEPNNSMELEVLEFKECEGRDRAEMAAREMLARYAGRFSHDTEISARICPEIDWAGD